MSDHENTPTLIDEHVKKVVAALPFPVQLNADMGGTFVLQIDLGNRGGANHPHDTAGIDPDDPRWWVDVEGGEKTFISDHGVQTDPAIVAAWIAETAKTANSPAAMTDTPGDRTRSIVSASFPSSPNVAVTSATATPASTHETPRPTPGYER